MFDYEQKAALCRKISNLYYQLGDKKFTTRSGMESISEAQEKYFARAAYDFEKLSGSLRLFFVRKSTLEEGVKNLESRLKKLKS